MTIMKKIHFFLVALLITSIGANAQTIVKGDMNGDGRVTTADITSVVDVALGTTPLETINVGISSPYDLDNSLVVGTWYAPDGWHFTLNTDGTTDFPSSSTYDFTPWHGRLLFYDATGLPVDGLGIWKATPDYLLIMNYDTGIITRYSSTKPTIPVTGITLSQTMLTLQPGGTKRLTATLAPAYASNQELAWTSSDANVVTVDGSGNVSAVDYGRCTITCTAQDGSGVSATCMVWVADAHEYVDLHLPSGTLWATCNIGADSPEDYGDYFAWGETSGYNDGKTDFSWGTYLYCNGDKENRLTKYCTYSYYGYNGFTDTLTELEPEDDAATVNWGSDWCMPSRAQIEELTGSYTTTQFTIQNGVYGRLITSKWNYKSIFLPAAGRRYATSPDGAGSSGNYLSRSLFTTNPNRCSELYFNNGECIINDMSIRCFGQSIRPVRASR